ncbi:thioesterase family protein [Phytohabitans sp. ZYX-F-186]|uniref:Thioesterase family protein n=1 Tax=Phytohabitans maris TaxID=3071409 RepID=A0ABU0Z9H9_9ACTN|nr:acyl-CoA thioesterase domain-containing protein [Phytohabitans sp. ZYX-F-186]MDQ7903716.1 thioesterase family protein [Phytohabitans sp. ZYX-F-186]
MNPGTVADLIEPEPCGPGLFRGTPQDTPSLRLFGGLVAAQAVVAAGRSLTGGKVVHSVHARFLRPGDSALPVEYAVEVVKDGRAFAAAQVTGRQRGRTLFSATVSAQVPEEWPEHQDPMPDAGDPSRCPSGHPLMARMSPRDPELYRRRFAGLDLRYVDDGLRSAAGAPMPARWWWRVDPKLPDDPLLHQAMLAYLTDFTVLGAALRPHRAGFEDPALESASLDHVLWYLRPLRADGWLLCDQESPSAGGGRGLGVARVFAEDGRLVALVAQEGMLRIPPSADGR